MAAIAAGDASALSELYDRLAPTVLGVCVRILRDRAEAEEVLSDVFLDLWRRGDRYDPARGAPAAYLVQMARSRALDRLRSRVRRERHEVLEEPPEGVPSAVEGAAGADAGPLERTLQGETRRCVEQAMAGLSAVQRRALELAFFDGMSHSEVAAAMGEPLGTVKTRIRQGMIHLRERLRPWYERGVTP